MERDDPAIFGGVEDGDEPDAFDDAGDFAQLIDHPVQQPFAGMGAAHREFSMHSDVQHKEAFLTLTDVNQGAAEMRWRAFFIAENE